MTLEQEYEQAVEIVAKRLFKIKYPAYVWEAVKPEEAHEFTEHARHLLSLTHPSGQRVLAVLSRDQTLHDLPPYDREKVWGVFGQLQAQGFRRTIQKERH